jgi:hypothetical protein
MASFGWTYLSREALRRAQAQLAGQAQGVRDEIGFLEIHQRYADRFFPGTSVLHTRLRYALFVPWMYEALARLRNTGSIDRLVEREELRLVQRLQGAGTGIIGGAKWPESSQQPPSVVYWGALTAWGIVKRRSDDRPWSRREVHRRLKTSSQRVDDDGTPLGDLEQPFIALPPLREGWDAASSLGFDLSRSEANFIRQRWDATPCSADPSRESLLARLAAAGFAATDNCWDAAVLELAGPDREALVHAGRAAALIAIGRGVYVALVEQLCAGQDGLPTQDQRRNELAFAVAEYGIDAAKFDIAAVEADIGPVSETLRTVLIETQRWVRERRSDPAPLLNCYTDAEVPRKTRRARLALTLDGRTKRAEWIGDEHPAPAPLHYRWENVQQLLRDLGAAT